MGAVRITSLNPKFQWKPFFLATQQYPEIDWLGGKFLVYYDVCARPPFNRLFRCFDPLSCHLTEVRKTIAKSANYTKNANCFEAAMFLQRKLWTRRHLRGEKLRCKIFGKESAKLFANFSILARKSAKFFTTFSATKVTSLPSLSLCISLSLSLSLSLSPSAPHTQYRKRFRASFNSQPHFEGEIKEGSYSGKGVVFPMSLFHFWQNNIHFKPLQKPFWAKRKSLPDPGAADTETSSTSSLGLRPQLELCKKKKEKKSAPFFLVYISNKNKNKNEK